MDDMSYTTDMECGLDGHHIGDVQESCSCETLLDCLKFAFVLKCLFLLEKNFLFGMIGWGHVYFVSIGGC